MNKQSSLRLFANKNVDSNIFGTWSKFQFQMLYNQNNVLEKASLLAERALS